MDSNKASNFRMKMKIKHVYSVILINILQLALAPVVYKNEKYDCEMTVRLSLFCPSPDLTEFATFQTTQR